MAVWLQATVRQRGIVLQPRQYAGSVCDDSTSEVAYAAYTLSLPLPQLVIK